MSLIRRYSEKIEAGIDEAGRGCLAGPVVAAAVILPQDFDHAHINDSKKLTPRQRVDLASEIQEKALAVSIGVVDNDIIDRINILQATFQAMNEAVRRLDVKPELLLIDGNRFRNDSDIPFTCFVKGDSRLIAIAAASIIAKTYRDALMNRLDEEYPMYYWKKNKGYPTLEHRKAISEFGLSPYHRKSFQLYLNQKQLRLPF